MTSPMMLYKWWHSPETDATVIGVSKVARGFLPAHSRCTTETIAYCLGTWRIQHLHPLSRRGHGSGQCLGARHHLAGDLGPPEGEVIGDLEIYRDHLHPDELRRAQIADKRAGVCH